tara:strand:+ start:420 stop:674 length:255 start_codon:yes stop_codon:yes gene_type:complete
MGSAHKFALMNKLEENLSAPEKGQRPTIKSEGLKCPGSQITPINLFVQQQMDVDGGDAEPKGTDVSETGVPTDNVKQEEMEELK